MKSKSLRIYGIALVLFAGLLFLILRWSEMPSNPQAIPQAQPKTPGGIPELGLLLLQIIVIITVSRLFGWLFKKVHQPAVIGEMIAGIALGPSLLGWFFPELHHSLFAPASLNNLQFLSQLGLVLFMFVIGLELDLAIFRKRALDALAISHVSIMLPFALGMVLAHFLYSRSGYAGPFIHFALFMGIAMSITAFPVLARILQERRLTHSPLGALALTCAAIGDVTAWCILALLIAFIKADGAWTTIVWVVVFLFCMAIPLRWLLKKWFSSKKSRDVNRSAMALVLVLLLICAYVAERIGIHALFGAFALGLAMPEDLGFRKQLTERIEDLSVVLLLPLFFVMTGLKTQINLLGDGSLWIIFAWILLAAVAGKLGGTALAARWLGQNWSDSFALGALMNTRGLMELIVLNIGYELGIFSRELFTMLVLMAIATTCMTGPLLSWIERKTVR